jgi:RNA polymerase sigma-70 factor (ECF subfamily)
MRPKLDPSDIVQDTFMLAHRSAARFRGSNLVEMLAWFHAILRNRLARAVRDQKYTQKRALHRESQRSPFGHPLKSIVDSDTPSHLAQDNEERELLDLAFLSLSEVDRLLITDHYINGLSFTELAQKSGRTEAALRKHWSRAMARWCRGTQMLAGINPRINL